MFGGVGIYSADLFFAIVDEDTLYLKVDRHPARFRGAGMGSFRRESDGEVMQYTRCRRTCWRTQRSSVVGEHVRSRSRGGRRVARSREVNDQSP